MARESVVLKEKDLITKFCWALLTVMLVFTLSPLLFMFYTSVLPAGDLSNRVTELRVASLTDGEGQLLRGEKGVLVTGESAASAEFILTNPEAGFGDRVYDYQITYNADQEGTVSFAASLPQPQILRFENITWEMRGAEDLVRSGQITLTGKAVESASELIAAEGAEQEELESAVSLPLAPYVAASENGNEWTRVVVPIEAFDFESAGINTKFLNLMKITWTEGEGTVSFRGVTMNYVDHTLINYWDILTMKGTSFADFLSGGFGRYFLNSFFVSAMVTLLNLVFASMAGYVFARRNFPLKNIIFMIIIGTLMIPPQVTIVPMFILMNKFGWLNTYQALIVPSMVIPFNIFLLRQYIRDLPVTLEEAARIDGANDFQIFYHVVLPLCKPVLAVVGINTFMGSWNTFIFPLILAQEESMWTLPVGLAMYKAQHEGAWVQTMAGAAITAIPVIIVFLIFQKMIISGLTRGAVKE